MKKFWAEFKKFISKGNIIDLAIAFIIGASFNKIVSSLVNDVIMPLISFAIGGADVSDWKWVIKPAEYDAAGNLVVAESALRYGNFIQTIIDFLIIAFTLFIMFKIFNYSKNQLNKLGESIVHETQKLKEKSKKKKDKKGKEVVEETTEQVIESTPIVEEKPAEPEAKVETKVETTTNEKSTKTDDMMVALLIEIRDELKNNKK